MVGSMGTPLRRLYLYTYELMIMDGSRPCGGRCSRRRAPDGSKGVRATQPCTHVMDQMWIACAENSLFKKENGVNGAFERV